MNFNKLLPNASKNKREKACHQIIYVITTKWNWSWQEFENTPIPVIFSNLDFWQKEQKQIAKAHKKK